MSLVASRARSVGPFVKIVPSATSLSWIDGFFSFDSSTSTCVGSASCFSSFLSFAWAYSRRDGVTSTFLPFTSSRIDASLVVVDPSTRSLPNGSCESDDVYLAGTCGAQGSSGRVDGGTRRVHVVDEHDAVWHLGLRRPEGSAHVPPPLGPGQPRLP